MIVILTLMMRYISTTPIQSDFEDYICSSSSDSSICESRRSSDDSNSSSSSSVVDDTMHKIILTPEYTAMRKRIWECIVERKKCIDSCKIDTDLRTEISDKRKIFENCQQLIIDSLTNIRSVLEQCNKADYTEICNRISDYIKYTHENDSVCTNTCEKEFAWSLLNERKLMVLHLNSDGFNSGSDETDKLGINHKDAPDQLETGKTLHEKEVEIMRVNKLKHIAEALTEICDDVLASAFPCESIKTVCFKFLETYTDYVTANEVLNQLVISNKFLEDFTTTTETLVAETLRNARLKKEDISMQIKEALNKVSLVDQITFEGIENDVGYQKTIKSRKDLGKKCAKMIKKLFTLRKGIKATLKQENESLLAEQTVLSSEQIVAIIKTIDQYILAYRKLMIINSAEEYKVYFVDAKISEVIIMFKQVILRAYNLILSSKDISFEGINGNGKFTFEMLRDEIAKLLGVFYNLSKFGRVCFSKLHYIQELNGRCLNDESSKFVDFIEKLKGKYFLNSEHEANTENSVTIKEVNDVNTEECHGNKKLEFDICADLHNDLQELHKHADDVAKFFDDDIRKLSKICRYYPNLLEASTIKIDELIFNEKVPVEDFKSELLKEIQMLASMYASNSQKPKACFNNNEMNLYHTSIEDNLLILNHVCDTFKEFVEQKRFELNMACEQVEIDKCEGRMNQNIVLKLVQNRIVRFSILVERIIQINTESNFDYKESQTEKEEKSSIEILTSYKPDQGNDCKHAEKPLMDTMTKRFNYLLQLQAAFKQKETPRFFKLINQGVEFMKKYQGMSIDTKVPAAMSNSEESRQNILNVLEYNMRFDFIYDPEDKVLYYGEEGYDIELLERWNTKNKAYINESAMRCYNEVDKKWRKTFTAQDQKLFDARTSDIRFILQTIKMAEANIDNMLKVVSLLQKEIEIYRANRTDNVLKDNTDALLAEKHIQGISESLSHDSFSE